MLESKVSENECKLDEIEERNDNYDHIKHRTWQENEVKRERITESKQILDKHLHLIKKWSNIEH